MLLQVESMVTFVIKIAVMIVDEVMVAMIVGYTDNKNSLSNICPQLIHLETRIFLILSMGVGYTIYIVGNIHLCPIKQDLFLHLVTLCPL